MNYRNEWLNAIFGEKQGKPIIVYFTDGKKVNYTGSILSELKTDPTVQEIIDGETGELIFSRTSNV